MNKPRDLARRALYRVNHFENRVDRLCAFLNLPDASQRPGYARIVELLELMRARRDGEIPFERS